MYQFNPEYAEKYWLDEAIFLQFLIFWIQKNQANEKHFYDGKHWTYNSQEALVQIFPFWNIFKIRKIISSLKSQWIIETWNFNKNPYDKTLWYSISKDEFLWLNPMWVKCSHRSEQNAHIDISKTLTSKWVNRSHHIKETVNIPVNIQYKDYEEFFEKIKTEKWSLSETESCGKMISGAFNDLWYEFKEKPDQFISWVRDLLTLNKISDKMELRSELFKFYTYYKENPQKNPNWKSRLTNWIYKNKNPQPKKTS